MVLLTLANLLPHGPAVSWGGMAHNLIPVMAGNVVSGATFMGAAYWYVTDAKQTLSGSPLSASKPAEAASADD